MWTAPPPVGAGPTGGAREDPSAAGVPTSSRILRSLDEAHLWAQALGAFLFSGILVMIALAGPLVAELQREPSEGTASESLASRS